MSRYAFYTCDVFTTSRFGGNQLAVLPDARGLTTEQMQRIAREFNFAESTFVLPSESCTRRVRIFTPTGEMPFAGHPNIGTAYTLAATDQLGPIGDGDMTITFEEIAGTVPLRIGNRDGRIWCELTAPQPLSFGRTCSVEALARAISLEPSDIVVTRHQPQEASVGAQFLFAELRSADALARARPNLDGIAAIEADGLKGYVHLYTMSGDEFDIRARMFAPSAGILEDPATGSANVALAAMLAHYDSTADGDFSWRIGQGIEMGRPSVLDARAEKRGGVVGQSYIGGSSVLMMEGTIEVG